MRLRVRGRSRGEVAARVEDLLAGRAPGRPRAIDARTSCPAGQQQRVALARALSVRPRVLLLDEPLSNLDANLRVLMRDEIKRLQRELRLTVAYVTHDQEEAMSISDRIAVMRAGRIEQVGTPTEIYERPATEFVARFVGTANFLDGEVAWRRRRRAPSAPRWGSSPCAAPGPRLAGGRAGPAGRPAGGCAPLGDRVRPTGRRRIPGKIVGVTYTGADRPIPGRRRRNPSRRRRPQPALRAAPQRTATA